MGTVTPIETAAAVYDREPCKRSFQEDLHAHYLNGYVFSTPTFFAMGRKVRKDAPHEDIVNPWIGFNPAECDTWMLYLYTGNITHAFKCADVQLPYVCFERRNKLRFYPWDVIFGRTERICKS